MSTKLTPKTNTGGALGCLLVIISLLLAPVLEGLALATMWGWFISPLGVPVIGKAAAVGVAITARLMLGTANLATKVQEPIKSYADGVNRVFTIAIAAPLFAILIGYLVKLFM